VTENVCCPSATPVYVFGLAQTEAASPSNAHRNVTSSSLSVNEKLGEESLEGSLGFELRVGAAGGVPSTATVGCTPCRAKGVTSVLRLVVHSEMPSAAGAVEAKVSVSVAPGQRSAVPPGETASIVVPFSDAVQVAAEQLPAAEVVAASVVASTANPPWTAT
jgi:hypothetical protein